MNVLLVDELLKPLSDAPLQAYLDSRLQLFDVLEFILKQTGPADVSVSTFSTSEEFLRRMMHLKKLGLVKHARLLADLKAAKKTVNLYSFMSHVFNDVYLGENHSKVLLIHSDKYLVTVVTSQNQTRGNRNESGMISTDQNIYFNISSVFDEICNNKSIHINEVFRTAVG